MTDNRVSKLDYEKFDPTKKFVAEMDVDFSYEFGGAIAQVLRPELFRLLQEVWSDYLESDEYLDLLRSEVQSIEVSLSEVEGGEVFLWHPFEMASEGFSESYSLSDLVDQAADGSDSDDMVLLAEALEAAAKRARGYVK